MQVYTFIRFYPIIIIFLRLDVKDLIQIRNLINFNFVLFQKILVSGTQKMSFFDNSQLVFIQSWTFPTTIHRLTQDIYHYFESSRCRLHTYFLTNIPLYPIVSKMRLDVKDLIQLGNSSFVFNSFNSKNSSLFPMIFFFR